MTTSIIKQNLDNYIVPVSRELLESVNFKDNDLLEIGIEENSIVIKKAIEQPINKFIDRLLELLAANSFTTEEWKAKGLSEQDIKGLDEIKKGNLGQDIKDFILQCHYIGYELVFKDIRTEVGNEYDKNNYDK